MLLREEKRGVSASLHSQAPSLPVLCLSVRPQYQRHDLKGEWAPSLPPAHLAKTHPLGRDGHGLNRCGVLEEDRGQFWILGSPGGGRSGAGPEEGLGEDRTGWCHTHLEDLHLLQHQLLHLLVILGQHDDLLHCPAVWNGPGRASVGLRMLGKGHQPQPLPPPGPKPQRAVEQQLPSNDGKRSEGTGPG